MNKQIYVQVKKMPFAARTAEGISRCAGEAGIYASCATSQGLGIEHKKCQKEFNALMACMRKK
jgi:hypothetical protein